VLPVAASYPVIAWLALQIADVALEPWELPGWMRRAPLVITALGFPIAIALAWFFGLGEPAVTRDAAADGAARPVAHGWRRHDGIVVISVLGAGRLFCRPRCRVARRQFAPRRADRVLEPRRAALRERRAYADAHVTTGSPTSSAAGSRACRACA
jgi:hypothetical protein